MLCYQHLRTMKLHHVNFKDSKSVLITNLMRVDCDCCSAVRALCRIGLMFYRQLVDLFRVHVRQVRYYVQHEVSLAIPRKVSRNVIGYQSIRGVAINKVSDNSNRSQEIHPNKNRYMTRSCSRNSRDFRLTLMRVGLRKSKTTKHLLVVVSTRSQSNQVFRSAPTPISKPEIRASRF